jgi:hypothetical protein
LLALILCLKHLDISKPMLRVGVEREVSGDTIESDIGQGLPFRSGMFDGAISVSHIRSAILKTSLEYHIRYQPFNGFAMRIKRHTTHGNG